MGNLELFEVNLFVKHTNIGLTTLRLFVNNLLNLLRTFNFVDA